MPAPRKLDREQAFGYWWNGAQRRSWADVADHFNVGESTVRRAAAEEGWKERAARLDSETRRRADAALARTAADRLEESLRLIDHQIAMFARRLLPVVKDAKTGELKANPHALSEAEIDPSMFIRLVEVRAALERGPTPLIDQRTIVLDRLSDDDLRALADAAREGRLTEAAEKIGIPEAAVLDAEPDDERAFRVVEGGGQS